MPIPTTTWGLVGPVPRLGIDTVPLPIYLTPPMTLLDEAVEAKKFDVRVVERNIDRGQVGQSEYSKLVKSLPDDGENAEWVNIETLAAQEEPNGQSR